MKKNNLFLIAGHNGAGKTTFLKEFVRVNKLKYINPDEIAQKIYIDRFPLLIANGTKDNYQILDNENFDKFLLIVKNKEER